MVWNFIGVYIINRTLHGRLEIRNISVRPCSILYLFTSKQRKVGSRKRETGEPDLADFIFKMAGRVMADDYHIYIELLRTQTSFSLGVNLRVKEGRNFLLSSQTKPFYPRFFEPNQIFPRRLGKSGFNSTGRSGRAVFSHRILYSAVI